MDAINLYSKQQKLVTVNSEGSIESIFDELSKHLKKIEWIDWAIWLFIELDDLWNGLDTIY